jgi:hypothetical protein
MVKWLARLAGNSSTKAVAASKYGRTPIPPKPYQDRVDGNIAIREDKHNEVLANVDPERPHWRDPKFESRKTVPVFDFFGFNRNWSTSLWKLGGGLTMMLICFQETRLVGDLGEDGLRFNGGQRSAVPGFARDEMATERELRAAGFSYVGVKDVDNIGAERAKADAQRV